MSDGIHLTVATTCVKQGKILVVKEREYEKLVINQPAGHVEPGEGLKEAALRETLEETGYQVELQAILGFSVFSAPNGITYYRVSFLADCPDQEPVSEIDPDIEEAVWMSPDEILQADNHRSHLVSLDINRYISGQRYPLEMIVEKP